MEQAFGKYTLVQRLGGGGMAEVFKARLTGPAGFEKYVALKLILPHFSDEPEFVQMFIHEANLAARLDHANIVRIHEFDRVDGRYYIAMELVDGADLRHLLALSRKVDRPLRVPEAVIIAREVCRGLAFAHGELTSGSPEVIHRDVSPHNVILSRAGEVKLTDFGIAKLRSTAGLTGTGIVKGKLAYMSPEQSRGADLDGRSDLFSLGCVLWEMLTGRRLFAGENEAATLENLKSAPIRPPSAFNPDVSPALDALVGDALARHVEDRVTTASELGRRLDEILDGEQGLDRAAALVELFRDLSASRGRPGGTAVMAADGGANSRPERHHGLVSDRLRAQDPPPAEPGSLRNPAPVGPDAPTEVAPLALSAGPARPRLLLRWWMIALVLFPLGAAFAAVIVMTWMEPSSSATRSAVDAGPQPGGLVNGGPFDGGSADGGSADGGSADGGGLDGGGLDGGGPNGGPALAVSQDGGAADGDPVDGDGTEAPDGQADGDGAALPAQGRLNLNAIPWAKVYLRGKLIGETPLTRRVLPAGRHTLILVNDALGVRRRVKVRIRPGRVTSRVVELKGPPAAPGP